MSFVSTTVEAFVAMCKSVPEGSGIADTACSKSMIGERRQRIGCKCFAKKGFLFVFLLRINNSINYSRYNRHVSVNIEARIVGSAAVRNMCSLSTVTTVSMYFKHHETICSNGNGDEHIPDE